MRVQLLRDSHHETVVIKDPCRCGLNHALTRRLITGVLNSCKDMLTFAASP